VLSREQAFGHLRRNLELTGLQEQTVATRQRNVREAVAAQLEVTDAFLTGSYRRHTLIGPLRQADVDVMVVLDRSYRARGPRAVLDLVRDVLLAEYTRTPKISRNGQAVTITFSDFVIDVVPAFRLPWWSWNEGWEICDSSRERWITTNPAKHVDISARANKAHSGNLVPRIKQLKAWNRTVGEPLRSFHLEALAWSVFGTSAFWGVHHKKSDWESSRFFFDKARSELRRQLGDPAGTGADVGAYLSGAALDAAVTKVESAHDRCTRAEQAAKDGKLAAMHDAYKKVFGDAYPG
jgi:Second Messenger Oligonucleotide or Dinucleotide Synthetase domain